MSEFAIVIMSEKGAQTLKYQPGNSGFVTDLTYEEASEFAIMINPKSDFVSKIKHVSFTLPNGAVHVESDVPYCSYGDRPYRDEDSIAESIVLKESSVIPNYTSLGRGPNKFRITVNYNDGTGISQNILVNVGHEHWMRRSPVTLGDEWMEEKNVHDEDKSEASMLENETMSPPSETVGNETKKPKQENKNIRRDDLNRKSFHAGDDIIDHTYTICIPLAFGSNPGIRPDLLEYVIQGIEDLVINNSVGYFETPRENEAVKLET